MNTIKNDRLEAIQWWNVCVFLLGKNNFPEGLKLYDGHNRVSFVFRYTLKSFSNCIVVSIRNQFGFQHHQGIKSSDCWQYPNMINRYTHEVFKYISIHNEREFYFGLAVEVFESGVRFNFGNKGFLFQHLWICTIKQLNE